MVSSQALAAMLDHHEPPTAVFTTINPLLVGLLHTVVDRGARVEVVASESLDAAFLSPVPLHVISGDPSLIARAAAERLIFTSDNGPSAEERNWLDGEEVAYQGGSAGGLRGHKGSLFEGGIRVPCIWSWPAGLPQGVTSGVPASSMDLVPTIAAAAELDAGDVDGVDLLPTARRRQRDGPTDPFPVREAIRRPSRTVEIPL